MKAIVGLLTLLTSLNLFATSIFVEVPTDVDEPLTLSDFQSMEEFGNVTVTFAERYFYEDLLYAGLYKVEYHTNSDCNEQICPVITNCEYVWIDETQKDIIPTKEPLSCDQDIEDITGEPTLVDEL